MILRHDFQPCYKIFAETAYCPASLAGYHGEYLCPISLLSPHILILILLLYSLLTGLFGTWLLPIGTLLLLAGTWFLAAGILLLLAGTWFLMAGILLLLAGILLHTGLYLTPHQLVLGFSPAGT